MINILELQLHVFNSLPCHKCANLHLQKVTSKKKAVADSELTVAVVFCKLVHQLRVDVRDVNELCIEYFLEVK